MLELLKNYSILYVEDELQIKEDIEEYLNTYFKTLYSTSDGESALALYYKHLPDVVLLDISLPKINGLALAKEIRQHNDDVKIIMLTAHDDRERLLVATELKLTKYLVKPFSPRKFKETLNLLVEELQKNDSNFLHLGDAYVWNKITEQLLHQKEVIKLCEKEHRLLKLLLSKETQTTTYEDIMVAVWENSFDQEISLDSVKNLVSRLRKKLPTDFVNSVYKEGYSLNKI